MHDKKSGTMRHVIDAVTPTNFGGSVTRVIDEKSNNEVGEKATQDISDCVSLDVNDHEWNQSYSERIFNRKNPTNPQHKEKLKDRKYSRKHFTNPPLNDMKELNNHTTNTLLDGKRKLNKRTTNPPLDDRNELNNRTTNPLLDDTNEFGTNEMNNHTTNSLQNDNSGTGIDANCEITQTKVMVDHGREKGSRMEIRDNCYYLMDPDNGMQLIGKIIKPNAHECGSCEKTFLTLSELLLHIAEHRQESSSKPKECDNKGDFRCSYCGEDVDNITSLNYHVQYCKSLAKPPSPLLGEFEVNKKREMSSFCPYCCILLASPRELLSHNKEYHMDAETTKFKCKECLKTYNFMLNLKKHFEKFHVLKCRMCDYKILKTESEKELLHHCLTFHGEAVTTLSKPFYFDCYYCDLTFDEEMVYRKHEHHHLTGERYIYERVMLGKRYKCRYCDEVSNNHTQRLRHERKIHNAPPAQPMKFNWQLELSKAFKAGALQVGELQSGPLKQWALNQQLSKRRKTKNGKSKEGSSSKKVKKQGASKQSVLKQKESKQVALKQGRQKLGTSKLAVSKKAPKQQVSKQGKSKHGTSKQGLKQGPKQGLSGQEALKPSASELRTSKDETFNHGISKFEFLLDTW